MSDTSTATPPVAAATSTPRRTAARPTVSVRPAAVGAVNAATIAGATIVAAGGGAILAVAAGGAALAATAAGARRTGQVKASRQAGAGASRTPSGGGGRSAGVPRASRSGAASPGSRGGAGRPSAGSRSNGTAGGKRSGGSGVGSLLPKSLRGGGRGPGPASSGRGRSGASGGGSAGRGGASTSGHRRAGSQPGSGSRSPLTAGKVAAARRKLAARRQPGPRLSDAIRSATAPTAGGSKPTARQAFGAARRAVTGDTPKNRGTVRRATAGLIAGGLAAGKAAYDARQRRRKRDAARQAKNDRITARRGGQPGVGTTVRRAAGAADHNSKQRKPAPLPLRAQPGPFKGTILAPADTTCRQCGGPVLKGEWAYPTGGGSVIGPCCGCGLIYNDDPATPTHTREGLITMTHPLLAISEDFLAAAARNQPEGMLQVTAEAHLLPQVMENFVKAMKIRFDRAQEHPLHPGIKDMYGLVHKAQVAVQQNAAEIGPTIEKVHERELYRLRNPRVGEDMWDVARNRGAA